ncbi:hypothetical protein BDQ17DRAFT_1304619, partial [Cyathus striatus]
MASTTPTTASPNQPRIVRITNHGKIKHWVTKSLEFLEDGANIDQTLVLHTLPFSNTAENPKEKEKKKDEDKGSVSTTLSVVPRLISVVEIIKREYLRRLGEKKSSRLEGLYQYNEIGILEDLEQQPKVAQTEEERAKEILSALEGKNHVKQVQTPYMRITLALKPVEGLVEKGATFQPPS